MRFPLVSIIIPVYNGSAYMREAIDSALSQTYENIEVLVVNDGSTDGGRTEEIALSYGDRIRYFYKENGGVSTALNLGIRNMKGEYFSWLSHDDSYEPRKIEEQVISLQGKEMCVSICNTRTIDKDSNVMAIRKNQYKDSYMSNEEALMYITKYGANGCSLLIPRKAFEEVGLFNEELRYCQDILMWWEIFLAGYALTFIDYVGVSYRVHASQVTQTNLTLFRYDSEILSDIVIPQFSEVSKKNNNILYRYAWDQAKQGNTGVLHKCIKAARQNKLFSIRQNFLLWCVKQYGKIRPCIRRLYYRLRFRTKTR